MMVQDLVFPYCTHFRYYSPNRMYLCQPVFGPREYVGSHRSLKIRFYRLVGRVQTLRVPARRHRALI